MRKPAPLAILAATLATAGCSLGDAPPSSPGGAGSGAAAGASGSAGASAAGTTAGGSAGAAPTTGGASGAGGSSTAGTGGSSTAGASGNATAGASGSAGTSGSGGAAGAGGSAGAGGATAGTGGSAGTGGMVNIGGGVNNVPGDYKGTPYATLVIPGRINTCDYDRGGAGVAYCHDPGGCGGGTTGDYPQASGVYRTPMPAGGKVCGGAACDDNVGVCRMNPQKPDNTITGQPMPATDTYLCYSVPGEWTKYTVHVTEAGTYSIACMMGVQVSGAGFNLTFGQNISSGNIAVTNTPTANSGSGEGFHSWEDRKNLGTVTFPAVGTYLMTFTQVSRINADYFTFTKM